MASKSINITQTTLECKSIIELIKDGKNFLLSGGAGSGKTYSLVEVISEVLTNYPLWKIACITYTNAAVNEIEHRISNPNLRVSTIHDFLWENIKTFQNELRTTLTQLINDPENTKFKIADIEMIPANYYESKNIDIQYKEYLRISDGIISHDEIIILADLLFKQQKKLVSLVKDRYQLIVVDEYQDTAKTVVDIFLKSFTPIEKKTVIGFFGDAMQSIYDGSVGGLSQYITNGEYTVVEVKKEENRRNPESVIFLANKLRTDGIVQKPSNDIYAPNMSNGVIKKGTARFIYSKNKDLSQVRSYLDWRFEDTINNKELNLTHNLIAEKSGFLSLMEIYDKDLILAYRDRIKEFLKTSKELNEEILNNTFGNVVNNLEQKILGTESKKVHPTPGQQEYIILHENEYQKAKAIRFGDFIKMYVDKDQLIDDKKNGPDDEARKGSKRDDLIKHLYKIQEIIESYLSGDIPSFIRVTSYKIQSVNDKKELRERIQLLTENLDITIGEVIEKADKYGLLPIDDKIIKFKKRSSYLYDRVCAVKYYEFINLYKYLEGTTPFSTQHKTKGSEYTNVLVILDNGNWSSYNFQYLFEETAGKESIIVRTQKLFYVCCTRAKDNLAVFYYSPTNKVIDKAKDWFGIDNVVCIDR